MEHWTAEESILDDLTMASERVFGWKVHAASPIKRGLLNLKWRILTDAGTFLLKQYNKDRFKKYRLEDLLRAFSGQMLLFENGVPCPRLLSRDGEFLLESGGGERFVAMEFCEGDLVPPGQANAHQMYDLGRATGRMHRVLNGGDAGGGGGRLPLFAPPGRAERLAHWNTVYEEAAENGKTELLPTIEDQRKATERFLPEALGNVSAGWAHRDLWADNLLFDGRAVTAILDFDRLNYDYPLLDAARAVLSCALDQDLDAGLAAAYMEGYREERKVEEGFLTQALRMLWYMESTWWITPEMDRHSAPPARFAKEMGWMARHLHELEDRLGNL